MKILNVRNETIITFLLVIMIGMSVISVAQTNSYYSFASTVEGQWLSGGEFTSKTVNTLEFQLTAGNTYKVVIKTSDEVKLSSSELNVSVVTSGRIEFTITPAENKHVWFTIKPVKRGKVKTMYVLTYLKK